MQPFQFSSIVIAHEVFINGYIILNLLRFFIHLPLLVQISLFSACKSIATRLQQFKSSSFLWFSFINTLKYAAEIFKSLISLKQQQQQKQTHIVIYFLLYYFTI